MTNEKVKKYSPKVRERAVRMVLEYPRNILPMGSSLLGSVEDRLQRPDADEWVKRVEVDRGACAGVPLICSR